MFRGFACVLGLHGLEKSRDVALGDRCRPAVRFISTLLGNCRATSAPIDQISLADRRGQFSQIVAIPLRHRRNMLAPID
jgi:hypothetical protein